MARIATAVGKYWVCKRCPPFVNEAQECLGGAGYVEESVLPRLYRQAPLNSIWEGSGNIQCLDVLRALRKEPASADAFFAELESVRGGNASARSRRSLRCGTALDRRRADARGALAARRGADGDGAAGVVLIRGGNVAMADAFCESRLGRAHGGRSARWSRDAPLQEALIERVLPVE